jgi:cobalt-zinc-cadmium resistance protein CzcA
LVFAVLLFLFLFREWLISLLILFISVMGITGCVLGLFFAGIPLNVSSYTGIIMIVGIIAENAIFTVHQFYESLRETGEVDTAIRYAIALRIRPKLMAAIGAILALSPLAWASAWAPRCSSHWQWPLLAVLWWRCPCCYSCCLPACG